MLEIATSHSHMEYTASGVRLTDGIRSHRQALGNRSVVLSSRGNGALIAHNMSPHEQRLLEIETARVRHAWAKAQIKRDGSTPALTKYLKESLAELGVLRANDLEMGLAGR